MSHGFARTTARQNARSWQQRRVATQLELMRSIIRGWFGRLIEILAVTAATLVSASSAAAQSALPHAHTTYVWVAASLGFADLGQKGGLAGQFALSTAVDRTLITLRAAGAGEFGDQAPDRAYSDVALLVGKRAAHPQIPGPENVGGTTASISLGVAGLHFNQPSRGTSPGRSGLVPAIAFDADVMADLRVIGLGVSIFGALGSHDRYLGAGLTFGLGKIH